MKRILFLIIIITTIAASCTNKKEPDLKESLKIAITPYITSEIKKEGEIDSISIVRVDTITEKKRFVLLSTILSNKVDQGNAALDAQMKVLKLIKKQYNILPNEMYKAEYEDKSKEFDVLNFRVQAIIDSSKMFLQKSIKADSITFLAYGVAGYAHYTKASNIVKQEPFYLFVNKDFKIIENKDFIKSHP